MMFKPILEYEFASDSYDLEDRGFSARLSKDAIEWTVYERRIFHKEGGPDTYGRIFLYRESVYSDDRCSTHFSGIMQERIRNCNLMKCLHLFYKHPHDEIGDEIWRAFNQLYYPEYVEDENNAWVQRWLPGLHNIILKYISRSNLFQMNLILST